MLHSSTLLHTVPITQFEIPSNTIYHSAQIEDLVAVCRKESHGELYSRVITIALVGSCHGQCRKDKRSFWTCVIVLQSGISLVGYHIPHKTHLLRTAEVLRQLLNNKTIGQVLGQFATGSDQHLSSDWGCTDALTVVAERSTSAGHLEQSRERWTNERPHSARV